MRKPAAFPHFPRSPPIIRYTLIRPQSFSIGSYLRGSSRRGGLMCVGLLSAADTYYSTTLIVTTSGTLYFCNTININVNGLQVNVLTQASQWAQEQLINVLKTLLHNVV